MIQTALIKIRVLNIIMAFWMVSGPFFSTSDARTQGKPSGDFCFRHESEAMMYECEEIQKPHHPNPYIQCFDPVTDDYVEFEPTAEWTRLSGKDCQPPEPRSKTPRGEDGDNQKK